MTATSKNVYINKLDDVVKEYNNTYHTTIKMKPVDVEDNTYIDFKKEINDKDPKFKVGDHARTSKYKNIFAKGYLPNWSEEIFVTNKIKNTVPWTYVINDHNGEEIIGTFYEKELQGKNQKKFRIDKIIKRKGNKLYVKWKGHNNSFNSCIDKKRYIIKMSKHFPTPYEPFDGDINLKVDLSNYATKDDIKNVTHVDTSKTNLANLKTEVDKLDIDKLKILPNNLSNLKTKVDKLGIDKLVPVPIDLSKLSNVIKNEVVKKTEYNAKIKNIEDKIPDISNLATKTILNAKINEVKNEIPSITGLATTSTLTAVENKIPSISNLVKKTDYNTEINEIKKKLTDHKHDKHITNPEFNKLAANVLNVRLAQANLVTKTDFDDKLSSLNRKITSNKTRHLYIKTN